MLNRHAEGKMWDMVYAVAKQKAPELLPALEELGGQSCDMERKIAAQRAELRRLNKPAHWAHLATKIYERISQEIDASLKRHGIELPLKVKN